MKQPAKKSRNLDSPLVGAIAIGLLIGAMVVSAAAQSSPWFAQQVSQLTGVSSTTLQEGGGGCCGGVCPIE